MLRSYWVAVRLLASQEGLCDMWLIIYIHVIDTNKEVHTTYLSQYSLYQPATNIILLAMLKT